MAYVVEAVATENLALSGVGQNAGGRTVIAGDKVLLTEQTSAVENGVWVVAAGAWARDATYPAGANAAYDTQFRVRYGSPVNVHSRWFFSDPDTPAPVIGTDDVSVTRDGTGDTGEAATTDTGGAFMDGLRLEWVSSTRVDIHTGQAYVPGLGASITLTATNSQIVSTGGTGFPRMDHLYLIRDVVTGEGAVFRTNTAPPDSIPYEGEARTMDPDYSANFDQHRYIGSILRDSTGAIVRFAYNPTTGRYEYITPWDALPVRVVNTGAATTYQTIETWTAANVPTTMLVPPGAVFAILFVRAGTANVELSNPDVSGVLYTQAVQSSAEKILPLNSSGQFQWRNSAGGSSTQLSVMGYQMPRS